MAKFIELKRTDGHSNTRANLQDHDLEKWIADALKVSSGVGFPQR